jgi:tetratricopeptide (TPR) repeat protein
VARGAQVREAPPRVEVDAVEAPRAAESLPPSEALARGLSAYAREAYVDAATAFREVLEGRTDDSPSSVEKARFFLAKSLFHLGFHHGALTVFDEVTRGGREHAHFVESLPWIARLADALELDRDPLLLEIVGRYSRGDLASLDTPETRASFDHLLFLLGRARYENRKLGEAVALFRRVRPGSKHHLPARFFEGVSQVRMRRARPAVAAFRSVIDAIDRGEHGGVDDPERMRDLAWLSLGRMYYTAANREDGAGRYRVDGRVLGAAIDAWERIDQGSEHWLDALFEASWAFYLVGDYERALGRIHALESPFFRDAFYPEALVIRAVAHYSLCQLDATEAVLAEFRRRFDPLHAALVRVRRAHGDATSAKALLDSVHARGTSSSLSPSVARLLRRALGDRELLSESALVDAIAREEASVARVSDPSHEALFAWLGQELAVQRALADDHVGELVLARLDRLLDELRDRQNEIDAIDLEVTTMRRTSPPSATGGGDDVSIVADQEHMVWPFDGEYWRDELPYYRVRVQNRCGR